MDDRTKETLLFGAPICKGCDGLGHFYVSKAIGWRPPRMPDTPDGYADNWRTCFYCDGTGFESKDHRKHGTGHDPDACGSPSEAGPLIRCECCQGKCPFAPEADSEHWKEMHGYQPKTCRLCAALPSAPEGRSEDA